jgi:hypothetical protein
VHIVDNQVKASDVGDNAVRNSEVKDESLSGDEILDGSINSEDIGLGAIRSEDVGNNVLDRRDIDEDNLDQPLHRLRYVGDSGTVPATSAVTLDIPCAAEEYPLAGGFSEDNANVDVVASQPADTTAPLDGFPDGWRVRVANSSGEPGNFQAWAICAPAKDLRGGLR